MEKIGDNIRKLRELKNITREVMATELDMTVGGYSKIERNETDLTLSRIYKIAQILHVDLSQILNFDPSHVFNISDSKLIQSVNTNGENIHFHTDDHKEKYIKLLEEEVDRLKKQAKAKGK